MSSRPLLRSGRVCRYAGGVAIEPCPSVSRTSARVAPRSSASEACACRDLTRRAPRIKLGLTQGTLCQVFPATPPTDALQRHRNLLGRVILTVNLDLVVRAQVSLYGADRALGIGDGLALRRFADEAFAAPRETYYRRRRIQTFRTRDDRKALVGHDSNDRFCRAEIDSDNGSGLCPDSRLGRNVVP